MFPHGDRNRPAAKCETRGVACHDEPRAAARDAVQTRRSAHAARRNLPLVHGGLRYSRLKERKGAARRTERVAPSVWAPRTLWLFIEDIDPSSLPNRFPHPVKRSLWLALIVARGHKSKSASDKGAANAYCSARALLPRCLFDNRCTRQDDAATGGFGTQAHRYPLRRRLRLQPPHGEDEEATLVILTAHRKIIDSLIEQYHGRFVNSAGDSVLAELVSVVEAVNCAVDIQIALKAENAKLPPERQMEFRIGVNLRDVMVEGDQIYGDGINVAARLESLADPGGICISGTVHEQVRDRLALGYEDSGGQTVKNIAHPVRVWRPVERRRGSPP
jgi:hypothetical protein